MPHLESYYFLPNLSSKVSPMAAGRRLIERPHMRQQFRCRTK